MSRRRRGRDVLAVSLFPFLAVLICTLGVLIVLLVLAVKSTEDKAANAQQSSDAELQAQLDQLTVRLDARLAQVDGLQLVRPDAVKRLTDSRSTRHHLEAELKRLEQESVKLAETLLLLEQQQAGQSEMADKKVDDADLAKLEADVEDAKVKLERKRSEAKNVGPATYAIVPHQGVGGTFRRPIFVECRVDQIVLQPHGIVLQQADFLPPLFPGNMLDAALLTVREYWSKYDLDGDEGKAYPLLVVRPGGAETYTAARHAMKSWDDEFGYELVESDKTLDFGPADKQLAAEIQAAVDAARPRQLELAAMQRRKMREQQFSARNLRKSDRRPGLTVSGSQGGFVASGYGSDGDDEGFASRFGNEFGSGDGDNAFGGNDYADRGTGQRGGFDEGEQNDFASGEYAGESSDGNSFVSTGGDWGSDATAAGATAEGSATQSQSGASASSAGQPAMAQSQSASSMSSADGQTSSGAAQTTSSGTCLADSRGSGWALPTKTTGATAYVRPVRVICHSDHLIVRSGTTERKIPSMGPTSQAVDSLVDEIWRQIESWGSAGMNGYWKPELRVTVEPGAGDRFRTLQRLLHRSGLVLKEAN